MEALPPILFENGHQIPQVLQFVRGDRLIGFLGSVVPLATDLPTAVEVAGAAEDMQTDGRGIQFLPGVGGRCRWRKAFLQGFQSPFPSRSHHRKGLDHFSKAEVTQ